ncbi:MAG: DUF6399 domain-containing protein [Cyanobacteria bacterium P01_C01_bin.118]
MVVAAICIFGIKRGVGLESLSEFFYTLRIQRHVGVSVSSLRKIQQSLEEKILTYQTEQQERLHQACKSLPTICVGVDETWFDQTVLVMMELSSGYLLVEDKVEDHRYTTWQTSLETMLQDWSGRIHYCVNDRDKALIKLALNELDCPSIAYLFHAMRKLTRGLALELDHRSLHLKRRLRDGKGLETQAHEITQAIHTELTRVQQAQADFREHIMHISLALHPFDVCTHAAQTTQQVSEKLTQRVSALKQFKKDHQLKDAPGGIDQFSRQVGDLSAVVDLWWQWVSQTLDSQSVSTLMTDWITRILLPLCYWQTQTQRTDTPALKLQYQHAYQHAQMTLQTHPVTQTLSDEDYLHWVEWAQDMVTKFQRTTSAVEGRNGYLTQVHHNRRGLSTRQLKVLTVIHNFDLKRADGSTAAERLFKLSHPNLFQTVLDQMLELPSPRRRAKVLTSKSLPD